ncbi:terminase large subunit domain-containing protein [Ruegeria lacuscaerulensis]|uniref:terminase large subunit domain-containing protein n=1 Tax=Ruegeria lacuscaerulensis TaxID=55218 RepID=UPI00147F39D7|nr:terminase family protein [Ruegeria lacuscaerulensis]
MRSESQRLVVVAARQCGKSVISGALAAHRALTRPGYRIVLVAPSFRQSSLLADKIHDALIGSDAEVKRVKEKLTLPNQSTVTVLHGDRSSTLRGHTADLLIGDELCFCKPEIYPAILPMVGSTGGRFIAISSPNGPSGIVYDMSSQDGVQFMRIAADDVAHFNPDVIKEIRGRLGPALARQELDAEFVASASSVFDASALDAMFAPDVDLKVEGSDIPAQETALEQRFRRLQQDEDNDKRRSMGWPRI